MKRRDTPQALMVMWLQASPTPCPWKLMQARMAKQEAVTPAWAPRSPQLQTARSTRGRFGAVNE